MGGAVAGSDLTVTQWRSKRIPLNVVTYPTILAIVQTNYRVMSPFIGVKRIEGQQLLITIPAETIIEINGPPQAGGLVDIVFNGERLAVFWRDIHERADPVLGL